MSLGDPDRAYETACLFARATSSRWAQPDDEARAGVALAASAIGLLQGPASAPLDLDLQGLRANGWIRHLETDLLPDVLGGYPKRQVTPELATDLRTAWDGYVFGAT